MSNKINHNGPDAQTSNCLLSTEK